MEVRRGLLLAHVAAGMLAAALQPIPRAAVRALVWAPLRQPRLTKFPSLGACKRRGAAMTYLLCTTAHLLI